MGAVFPELDGNTSNEVMMYNAYVPRGGCGYVTPWRRTHCSYSNDTKHASLRTTLKYLAPNTILKRVIPHVTLKQAE